MLVDLSSGNQKKETFETDLLAAATTDADEVNIYLQKGSGNKDISGTLSI